MSYNNFRREIKPEYSEGLNSATQNRADEIIAKFKKWCEIAETKYPFKVSRNRENVPVSDPTEGWILANPDFKPEGSADEYFALYYWRVATAGIGYMRMSDDWKKADLYINNQDYGEIAHYHMQGPVLDYPGGKNLFINLHDVPAGGSSRPVFLQMSLLVGTGNRSKRNVFAGNYVTVERSTNIPAGGLFIMERKTEAEAIQLLTTKASEVEIPDKIYYALAQQRWIVRDTFLVQNKTYPREFNAEQLTRFAGTYRGMLVRSSSQTLEQFKLIIEKNGRAEMEMDHDNARPYIGHFKWLNVGFLMGSFDFIQEKKQNNAGSNSPEEYYYRYQFVIQARLDENGTLYGCFSGLSAEFQLISGRLWLKLDSAEIKVSSISLVNATAQAQQLIEEQDARPFFIGKSHKTVTDGPIINEYLDDKSSRGASVVNYVGNWFSYSLRKENHGSDANPNYEYFIVQTPIRISSGGSVSVVSSDGHILTGDAHYDGSACLRLTIQKRLAIDWLDTYLFMVHMTPRNKIQRAYGISMTRTDRGLIALTEVLIPTDTFHTGSYSMIHIDSERYIQLENSHPFLMSYINGDYNRIIELNLQPGREPRPRKDHYRLIHFESGCYWGHRYTLDQSAEALENCRQKLQQAYNHSFGHKQHPQDKLRLQEELKSGKGCLSAPKIQEIVWHYWASLFTDSEKKELTGQSQQVH
ncbi:hypothetical protein [Larkinella terrae]|uniref:Uncharacterized protein n=1 Tax=Larkinella terrae TaxID=2025311 RepID=A0A7K0ET46_9BACT|nr:hypothetical protein [Larkinella terrae]MRS64588.1 hypothetical protein [Larkinella terrae]